MEKELQHSEWKGTTYGNSWMHRHLVGMLRVIPPRLIYAFAKVFVIPPTVAINTNGRRYAYSFARKRLGLGRFDAIKYVFRNFNAFAEVIIDRFAMYAGRKFDVELEGYDYYLSLDSSPSGFVQLSSHIGNYELAGYTLKAKNKRFNALVFGGEKATVMANRQSMFAPNSIRMIPMSADMSHLFIINEALDNGEVVSMPADRVFGSAKSYSLPLLGANANLPQGPFVMAATKHVPMLFVAVMKEGKNRYRIIIRPIAGASEEMQPRKEAERMAREFANLLDDTVRHYPEQWYNYFNLWTDD